MRLFLFLFLFVSTPAFALYEGLQCVPYARAVSGVEIRGDAHTWWGQAQGRYDRGNQPKVGAVLSFKPHGAMRLGHLAAVRKLIDARTLLVSHANWSTIDGTRGHIEENVRVIDASPGNDWSEVQVWYTPNAALGTTRWPVNGFIYPHQKRNENGVRLAVANLTGGQPRRVRPDVQIALHTSRPNTQQQTLRLSTGLLAQIESAAAKERNSNTGLATVRRSAPAIHADPIGDLIANISR